MEIKEIKATSTYTAKDITVLEGLEPVRKRPGMYIGGTGLEGLHHLIWEVVDNGVDEAMAGHASEITVELLPENKVSIFDNGRGIPIDKHQQTGKSALETIMTTLHAGGKFGEGEGYKVSGGLHGVGVSVVNALSIWMRTEVYRDGNVYVQEFKRGKPMADVKKIGKSDKKGTLQVFQPDPTIFPEISFDWKKILAHLRQQAYLTKKLKLSVFDHRAEKGKQHHFYFEGGIKAFVRHLRIGKDKLSDKVFYVEKQIEEATVEISLSYVNDQYEHVFTFANNIYTPEGGTHMTGFRSGLTRVINDYAKKNNILKNGDNPLTGDDVREGLVAVLSVKLPDPQFEGQTKAKLGNPEIRAYVESVITEYFSYFLDENPQEAKRIIEKNLLTARARQAAKAARETIIRKGALEGMMLPGKLADCSSRKPEESEIFIVEGDSAGGCFSGDQKVALTDGRDLSFKDLVLESRQGKQNYCYTIKSDGGVGIEKILFPRLTKKNVAVLKITLDNGETITCTPDHKFMLRNGQYCEAQKLVSKISLMPLARKKSEIKKWMTIKGIEDFRKQRKEAYNQTYLYHSLALSKKILESGSNLDQYDQQRLALAPKNKNLLRLDTLLERFFNNSFDQFNVAAHNFNHKIVKIEKLTEKIDVYDIEVPNTHNFALASGVFVHNSSKMGRDRRTQAILPLRGKILNVERARLDRMISNEEIKSLIIALGVGIGEDINIKKLRYHKIIVMTDADVDGAHILTLLLTLFFRHLPDIIKGDFLYIAQPPLYQISVDKKKYYAFSDSEKEKVIGENPDRKISIQRYKGLGEMNPEQLWETTMDPEQRILKQVSIEDAEEADKVFTILMGSEVAPRKNFIQTHAKSVKNLDI